MALSVARRRRRESFAPYTIREEKSDSRYVWMACGCGCRWLYERNTQHRQEFTLTECPDRTSDIHQRRDNILALRADKTAQQA